MVNVLPETNALRILSYKRLVATERSVVEVSIFVRNLEENISCVVLQHLVIFCYKLFCHDPYISNSSI